ncbi:hypothetical protein Hrd1104_11585 [Halorhabdus sp. CBA1104]|uniref:DUF6612 family protein n=1 Tax=unclassified Halorhabdus TaxID=2621901 RepID=UPI0012B2BCAD|nr:MULTISPECIES: DUF6612 family protein [unclassified Halorhabdus]QGN07877.1 hypothetical protein Hrd1104_11585 [Halorhabdus sp. CBA1104]
MRSRALLVVALTVLVALSGCSALPGGGGDGGPTGEVATIQDESIDAISDISTYEFHMEMSATGDGLTVDAEADGAVNEKTQRMRMEMTMDGQEIVQYVDGATMYQQTNALWRTQDVSEQNLWDSGTVLETQRDLMDSSDVTLEGTTTIDGTEVYEIRIDPTKQAVEDLLSQQSGTGQLSAGDIDEIELTQYVRTDDSLPKRSAVSLTASAEGQTVDVDVTYTLENYGTDVSISIPEEATAS